MTNAKDGCKFLVERVMRDNMAFLGPFCIYTPNLHSLCLRVYYIYFM